MESIDEIKSALEACAEINFRPWVGEEYLKGLNGKRVLVLGESHYCKKELAGDQKTCPCCDRETMRKNCFGYTEEVVREFIGGNRYRSFSNFENGLLGREPSQKERKWLWSHVAFYNYVQLSQRGPRMPLINSDESQKAFLTVLKILQPDRIVAWGVSKLWNAMPNWEGEAGEVEVNVRAKTPKWLYKDIEGKDIPAMAIHHPSTVLGAKGSYWNAFYKEFIGDINIEL